MGLFNLVAFFIMLYHLDTLNAHCGVTDLHSSAQAAEALRPVAETLHFFLSRRYHPAPAWLAIPVLAVLPHPVAEAFDWRSGLR